MTILITGTAGFIGFSLAKKLLEKGKNIIGIDNLNNYYDTDLKEARKELLEKKQNYSHYKFDLSKTELIDQLFASSKPKYVINLAAQAGVRFSIENPFAYIESNIKGFLNILECCKKYSVEHLVYASSSSVYGSNTSLPFNINQNVDHPLSLYAATKKSNELMAHTYSHLFNLPTTGLRFFTVYGPWGRPDMALFKFTKNIINEEPIDVFNYGKHKRDFTFIDDITEALTRIITKPPKSNSKWDHKNPDPATSSAPWRVYNIGNNKPVNLLDYINAIEKAIGKKARINYLPLQPGDVPSTHADISNLKRDFDYEPITEVDEGINKFVLWYKEFYKVN